MIKSNPKISLDNDSELDDSIARLQQKLSNAGFNILEQSSANPVVNIWSVVVIDSDCSLLYSEGHGSSKKSALQNALYTLISRLSTRYFWLAYYLGDEVANSKSLHHVNEVWFKPQANGSWPKGVLNDELGDFYNPDGELNASTLIDVNSSNLERGICCIPFKCFSSDEVINVPVNIINNIYDSNGVAAGSSKDEARVNALSEIIGHYVQFKVIAEGISLPDISKDTLNRYPLLQSSIDGIEQTGYSLLVQDASLGSNYPVLVVTLINPNNQGVRTCFGAHPQFEEALRQSLSKLLQGQRLDNKDEFSEVGFDMDEISSSVNLEKHYSNSDGIVGWRFFNENSDYDCFDWGENDRNKTYSDDFDKLCALVQAEGNQMLISEYNEFDVYSCRIIIPGMSEIYPVDDLVWENNNVGINIRKQILKVDKTPEECEQLIQDLEDLNQDDECLVSHLIGIPADQESIFSDLCVAELITLLALKVQENERIQEGCEWLLHYKQINPKRLKTYQCINAILQLDVMTNYGPALEKLYTRSVLSDALALIDGEDVFSLSSQWRENSLMLESSKKIISHFNF